MVSGSFIPIQMKQAKNRNAHICTPQHGKSMDLVSTSAQEVCEIVYVNGVTFRIKSNMSLEMLKALSPY